jgi:hypothetical protein
MTTNAYIFMWCNEGLDSLVPITQYEDDMLIEAIKHGKIMPSKVDHILTYMALRARFNSQRVYEIYAMDCDEDLSEDDLRQCFDDDPQGIVDLIRERGIKLYSDYNRKKTKTIA